MPHIEKLAYSIKEVVQATSLCRSSIYKHIAAGRLKIRRIGGRTVIPAESLRAFLNGEA